MMLFHSTQNLIVVFVLLFSSTWSFVTSLAFSSRIHQTSTSIITCPSWKLRRKESIKTKLWMAKPRPSDNFNLDEILAFEAQLDLLSSSSDGDNTKDLSSLDLVEEEENNDDTSTNDIRIYTVPSKLHNKRIDAALAKLEPTLSRSLCGNLVTDGNVHLVQKGNKLIELNRKSHKVEAGDVLRLTVITEKEIEEIIPQDLPLDVLYEDEHMIVINKAAGMVVHPAAGNWDGTVVNAMAYYLANKSPYGSGDFVGNDGKIKKSSNNNNNNVQDDDDDDDDDTAVVDVDGTDGETPSFRPGIVHRLDKGTTGILLVAKTKKAHATLSEAFAARTVKKTYVAITVGNPGRRVVINKPIGRHPIHRQRMRVVPDPHKKNSSGMAPKDRIKNPTPSQAGRYAISYVDTLAFDGKLSFVQVRIETGRTHQIRVHLQDRHTPIYGDDIYGLTDWNKRLNKTHKIERPLLHAYKLELNHPITNEHMEFIAPMADDMKQITNNIWPTGSEERPELF